MYYYILSSFATILYLNLLIDINIIVRVLLKEIKVNDFFRKDIRRTLTHFNTSS